MPTPLSRFSLPACVCRRSKLVAYKFLDSEELTISTAEIGITAALFKQGGVAAGQPRDVKRVLLQHKSGGKAFITTDPATGSISNAGANGENELSAGQIAVINSVAEALVFRGIVASGAADAKIAVRLEGEGSV